MRNNTVRFIDLFAGLGGIRLGFENAFKEFGFQTECVMTSEIKPFAVSTLKRISIMIFCWRYFQIRNEFIPEFDFY